MSFYRPPVNRDFLNATGGQGLRALDVVTSVGFETSIGSNRWLEAQGVYAEAMTWRMSAGEAALLTVPVNEQVVLTYTVAPAAGGFEELARPALNTGEAVFHLDQDTFATTEAAAIAARDASLAAQYQAILAADIAAAVARGELEAYIDASGQLAFRPAPPPPPSESSPPPPPPAAGGTSGGWTEMAPAPPGGLTQDQAPAGGCQTTTDVRWDDFAQDYVPVLVHFNGSTWEQIR